MKITAQDFWKLLPVALERLDEHLFVELRIHLEMGLVASLDSGLKNPRPGEPVRRVIRTMSERHFQTDPLEAVIWLLLGHYVHSISTRTAVRRLGMDRRFVAKLQAAIYDRPGHSRQVRHKLLEACGLTLVGKL